MNKELEALKQIKRVDGNMSREQNQRYAELEKALTPPTADEVIKALSEYLGYEVGAWNEYGKMCFKSVYTSPFQKISKNYTTIIWLYGNAVAFEDELRLPPRLITMIGRFYESLEEEK